MADFAALASLPPHDADAILLHDIEQYHDVRRRLGKARAAERGRLCAIREEVEADIISARAQTASGVLAKAKLARSRISGTGGIYAELGAALDIIIGALEPAKPRRRKGKSEA